MEYNFISNVTLAIRRKPAIGLPGHDPSNDNVKVGGSLRGSTPLKGLTYEEESQYLPQIIGASPQDSNFRMLANDYWNNISVPIPPDGMTENTLQGKVVTFSIGFTSDKDKKAFDAANFTTMGELSKKGKVIDGVADFILFRHCLVYSKVANSVEDANKSAKILFYLYSAQSKRKTEIADFQARTKANTLFITALQDDATVTSLLSMFGANVKDFETLEDKHLALEALVKQSPKQFLLFMNDSQLKIKGFIKNAVERNIIYNPTNTDSYYYGENNDVLLGNTIDDAVLYLKSDQETNKEVFIAIKARMAQ